MVVGEQGQRLHPEAALGELHDLAEELEDRRPALVRAGDGGAPGHVPADVLGHELFEGGEVSLAEGVVTLPHTLDVRVLAHDGSSLPSIGARTGPTGIGTGAGWRPARR